jgi:DASS family divalent anion:Na+ symporter
VTSTISVPEPGTTTPPSPKSTPGRRLLALAAIYAFVAHVIPPPAGVEPAGWRVTGIFLATIAGFVLRPVPGAALVLVALTLAVLVGGLPLTRALRGFSAGPVWLVVAAMLMSQVLRETGVARRIALVFVRRFGRSSLGLSYSLVLSEMVLGMGIPSITARSGGIILPIARSIAELYHSVPGPTAALLGSFLMISFYQGSVIVSAMFLTSIASNALAASLAEDITGIQITWARWCAAGILPGVISCLIVPYVIYRVFPPQTKRTPAAAEYADAELRKMGPPSRAEWSVLLVFTVVILLWITAGWHGVDITVVALSAVSLLLVTNLLTWEGALRDHAVWDVFVWYGGLLTLGEVLNETGATKAFASAVGSLLPQTHWGVAFIAVLLVYFYAHYAFASITAHVVAMFPPFAALLIGLGAPAGLVVYSLALFTNLTAGLTHYGTTTAPIIFSQRYVSLGAWWRVGIASASTSLAIWLLAAFTWWRVIDVW